MAVEKDKAKKFIDQVEMFMPIVLETVPEKYRDAVKNRLYLPALEELKKLIYESRPPVFYLVGRSGHGKSSLINALANKRVAEVGDVKPTTGESLVYEIRFPKQSTAWKVIDSRGLFETTPPEGKIPVDTVERVKEDLKKHNPDVVLHVISAPEVRNLAHDLEVFSKIMREVKAASGVELPVIVVLTKVDTLGNPREWPPEENATKAAHISEALEYMARDVLKTSFEPYNRDTPYRGFLLKNSVYIAVIPVSSLWEDLWNIETLADLIGEKLPESALLDYVQAQRRKALLKKVSTFLIKRFSEIAAGVGAEPIPISDIFILTPLQILLIGVIGGLSCRSVSKETVQEYLKAVGLTVVAGVVFRTVARQLVKLIPEPGAGSTVSALIAYTGTYSIGKSAEAYFFEGTVKKPEEFKAEAEEEKRKSSQ